VAHHSVWSRTSEEGVKQFLPAVSIIQTSFDDETVRTATTYY
jgi:hypothetical protein